MAAECGLSTSTVQRIWRAFGLQPHRQETFKLSTDPDFVAKVRDVVGLYLSPPSHALVLCVDEKSQFQALDRSQTVLPMRPGQPDQNSIPLQARSESGVAKLYWFADKTFLGSAPPQSTLIWRPTPGIYQLIALDDHGRASSSTVTCQAAGAE